MMTEQSPLAVIGAGSWGTALAMVLARNGFATRLWGNEPDVLEQMQKTRCNSRYLPEIPLPEKLTIAFDLASLLDGVEDILLVIPSHAFRHVLADLKKFREAPYDIAWATKGIDPTENLLLHQLVEKNYSATKMAVISGPSFATEVALAKPTAVNIAANDDVHLKKWQKYFDSPCFRVVPINDMIGIQLGGAVKNVLAIATGISDGMELGANSRCALLACGLAEMTKLGVAMGARAETFMSLSCVGDLVLTGTDDQSRNRRFGKALGQGFAVQQALNDIGQVVEGLQNTKEVLLLAEQYQVSMPIVETVYKIIQQEISVQEAVDFLMGDS